jgi:hypothetical protein
MLGVMPAEVKESVLPYVCESLASASQQWNSRRRDIFDRPLTIGAQRALLSPSHGSSTG